MYDKILVPVDGSGAANRGLREAISLVKAHGGVIRLVHVVNELVLDYSYGSGLYANTVVDSLRAIGKQILDEAESQARQAGLTPERVMVETIGGPAATALVAEAQKWGAELIIMGTHGRRGLRRLALGSDAELVLRSASAPVLLVRSE